MNEDNVVKALAALAHPIRLKIFRGLVVAGESGMTPGALGELLEIPPATLSFHLKELNHSGLTTQERDGRSLIYRAAYDQMNAVLSFLTLNCCQGAMGKTDTSNGCGC
ncbi:MAG: metalloregulator ArsR/SmtB family transcription factor [Pseudomonadota bacterium]